PSGGQTAAGPARPAQYRTAPPSNRTESATPVVRHARRVPICPSRRGVRIMKDSLILTPRQRASRRAAETWLSRKARQRHGAPVAQPVAGTTLAVARGDGQRRVSLLHLVARHSVSCSSVPAQPFCIDS